MGLREIVCAMIGSTRYFGVLSCSPLSDGLRRIAQDMVPITSCHDELRQVHEKERDMHLGCIPKHSISGVKVDEEQDAGCAGVRGTRLVISARNTRGL